MWKAGEGDLSSVVSLGRGLRVDTHKLGAQQGSLLLAFLLVGGSCSSDPGWAGPVLHLLYLGGIMVYFQSTGSCLRKSKLVGGLFCSFFL